MNLVDSSGWLALFADTKNAGKFSAPLQDVDHLLVPTIVIYEVIKVLLREKGEETAIIGQAHMQQGNVIDLSAKLAIHAATLSLENRIPMADSIILSIARTFNAIIWTQDEHFKGLMNVKFFST